VLPEKPLFLFINFEERSMPAADKKVSSPKPKNHSKPTKSPAESSLPDNHLSNQELAAHEGELDEEDDFGGPDSESPMPRKPTKNTAKEGEKSRDFVLHATYERGVKFIRLWFTDILGNLKSVAIISDELEAALDEGITFDGSSIEGFAREEESDMIARPDPNTFTVLPFSPVEGGAVGRMFCDITLPDGSPSETDPRYVLKKQLKIASEKGYSFYVGPEVEFFYFKQPAEGEKQRPVAIDNGGYFDLTPLDVASPLRRKTALALEQMDIGVESSHHEGAPSQHEIDLRYMDALTMADGLMTFRLVVKEVASESGYYATFMPKPNANTNGSGMHLNMSLFEGGRNVFHDDNDPDQLSEIARYFIAGLLRHARELTLFTNQWVNSYKRLVPGFEAPTRVTWAMRNHADLVRVPSVNPGRESSRRVEYRSPDSACNPYLVFALLLAAGLEGIEQKYELPPVGESPTSEILPDDLNEAIHAASQSTLARRVLGDALFDKFLANKRMEWMEYRGQVHDYELDRYLNVL